MANGYWNRILRVDLTVGRTWVEGLPEGEWQKVLGGAGYGAKVLDEEVPASVKPYDPENRIIFAVGPIQATSVTGSAKFSIVGKSPQTGIFGETAAGGDWGIALKRAGYDALVIQGKSTDPVYLRINDDKVEIRDAKHLWGRDAFETNDRIQEELQDKEVEVAAIGQAGENRVAIACVVVGKHSFAGRCGMGAVMGSKQLKAISVKGTKAPAVHDPNKMSALTKEINSAVFSATKDWLRLHGTPVVLTGGEEVGDVPIKYWSGDTWKEGAQKIGTPNYTEVLKAKPWPCKFCVVGCHRKIRFDAPSAYATEGAGPEYETLGMFGAACMIDDLNGIAKANELCNRYGMDTISTGAFVAFSMECAEKGIIAEKEVDGFPLKWGNAEALIAMIHKIGNREGIGSLFADGIVRAAKSLSQEAEEIAVHVKGLDMPAHDPRAFFALALNYATGNRGGCHERGNPQVASMGFLLPEAGISENADPHTMQNTEVHSAKYQDYGCLVNSMCLCKFMLFGGFGLKSMLECLNAATGWNWDMDQFLQAGERIFNLQRKVNGKYGISRKDDKLPKRMFEAAKEGGRAGKVPYDFDRYLDRYYDYRGWDKDGRPTSEKLAALGIS